jgi:DNA polymerase-3 subunit epsilon
MKGKKLTLKRPLIIFDIESTGLNPATDRIIEISLIKVSIDGTKEVKTRRINPEIEISAEASAVHGIFNKDLEDAPVFKYIAFSLYRFMKGCDIGGYNSNRFDIPMLQYEFERVSINDAFAGANLIDVFNLYCHFNPRTLSAAYSEYCGAKLEAHKAEADAMATFEVLEAILNEHDAEIEDQTVESLANMSNRSKSLDLLGVIIDSKEGPVFAIGKHKGKLLKDYVSYCKWMLTADFSNDTKNIICKTIGLTR